MSMPFLDFPQWNGGAAACTFVEKLKAMDNKIAIIGASEPIAASIAKGLGKGNYQLLLIGDDNKIVNKLVREIKKLHPLADVECHSCAVDASWEADIIISAQANREIQIARKIEAVSVQKIIIVVYDSPDTLTASTVRDDHASADLQQLLPNSKIVKVFASRKLIDDSDPHDQHHSTQCLIFGENVQAVERASQIMEAAGFHCVKAQAVHVNGSLEKLAL